MKKIIISVFAIVLLFGVFAQTQDTMYVHKGQFTYEFAAKDVDSITFFLTKKIVPVESVFLNHTSATLNVGNTLTLNETILPLNATNKDVAWVSNNPAVAIVNNGIVTALSAGKATILVITEDGHHTSICNINVNAPLIQMKGDGPYIIYGTDGSATVVAFDNSMNMYSTTYPHRDSIGIINVWSQVGNYSFSLSLHDQITIPPTRYSMPEKVISLSDPHGDIDPFVKVLQGNNVIDQQLDWCFGTGHLIIHGDVMDRGDDQTTIYWLIYKLEKQAQNAGGAVHFLLGNHEVMVAQNDLRYLTQKYLVVAQKIGMGYDKLWSKQTELGRWVQSRNSIEVLGDMLVVHAGISPQLAATPLTIEQVNDTARKYIALPPSATAGSPRAALIMGSNGPHWYRGLIENSLYETGVDDILARFEVDMMVMGHTRVDDVSELYNEKVIGLDISNRRAYNLANGKSLGATIMPNEKWAINVHGNNLPFVSVPPPPPPPPPVITPENVVTYVQDPNVESLAAFLNGGTANYNITLMSAQLETWRQSYEAQFPEFEKYTIHMPRGDYQLSLTANYESGARWYMGPSSGTWQGIFPMQEPDHNPLCDMTFIIPRNSTTGTPPTGYNSGGAASFRAFVQIATGFTVLQDVNTFWFRSKADPNDWFVCVRY